MRHDEYVLQCSVVKLLREQGWVVFSIPNERGLGISDSVRMRASGLTKGAPDLVAWDSKGRCYWLELKTPTGRRSIEQECMETTAERLGIQYILVRSVDNVKKIL